MNLQTIIKKNQEYRKAKKLCDEMYKELRNINNLINPDDLKEISFEEIKEIYGLIQYCINDKNIENQIKELYIAAKKEKYPILNKAHYYPIINELDFLTDEQKNKLDYALMQFHNGNIMTGSSRWMDLNFDKETTDKILEFLYNKGIISKTYHLKCRCGSFECRDEIITEEQYNKFIKYHSITSEQIDRMTDEERDKYEDNWHDGYFEVGCWNDGGYEVCNIDDWDNARKIIYYVNNTEPDRSLDDILDI